MKLDQIFALMEQTPEEKQELVKTGIENAAKILFVTMKAAQLKNHITSTVEFEEEFYMLAFTKLNKPEGL